MLLSKHRSDLIDIAERPRHRFVQSFLIAFLVLSTFINPIIVSGVMILVVVFIAIDPVFKSCPNQCPNVMIFWIIFLIGLIGSANNDLNDVVRDCWYFGNVVLTLTFGYFVMWRIGDTKVILKAVALSACFVSIIHVTRFLIDPGLLLLPFEVIRDKVSSGYFLPLLGVSITIGDRKNRLNLFSCRRIPVVIFCCCIASIALSFSRTLLLGLLIVFFVMYSFFNFKNILRTIFSIGIILIVFVQFSNFENNSAYYQNDKFSFVSKLLNSVNEVEVINYNSMTDVNRNWRGFESYKAMQTFSNGNGLQHFFGRGFGSNVDLGFSMTLAGSSYRKIPVLHNGYLYVLVKTGIIGLILYITYFVFLIHFGKKMSMSLVSEMRFSGQLLILLGFIVIETTFVIGGVFNKGGLYPVVFLIGAILYNNRDACIRKKRHVKII